MTSTTWKKIFEFDTILSADSVEWCPIEPYQLFFTCGTYFLVDGGTGIGEDLIQHRKGSLILFEVSKSSLNKVQQIETFGILDSKWQNNTINENIVLATVNAIGDVTIYRLHETKIECLTSLNTRLNEKGDYMTLSLRWFSSPENSKNGKLCVSDNKGNGMIILYEAEKLELVETWNAHSLEAWSICFGIDDSLTIYSGGDDAKLRIWDQRTSPISKVTEIKSQDSGVTILETHNNQLLSGSFDEQIHFWDNRQWKTSIYSIKTSGGPWRAKFSDDYLLTANIYGGYQIFDCSQVPKLLSDYKEHDSLAYGADWCHLHGGRIGEMFFGSPSTRLIGTCSFYDHKLTVSVWDPND